MHENAKDMPTLHRSGRTAANELMAVGVTAAPIAVMGSCSSGVHSHWPWIGRTTTATARTVQNEVPCHHSDGYEERGALVTRSKASKDLLFVTASAVLVRCDRRGMDCAHQSLTGKSQQGSEGLPMLRSLKDLENSMRQVSKNAIVVFAVAGTRVTSPLTPRWQCTTPLCPWFPSADCVDGATQVRRCSTRVRWRFLRSDGRKHRS